MDSHARRVTSWPRRWPSAYWWSVVARTQPAGATATVEWSFVLATAFGDAEDLDDEVLERVAHGDAAAVGTRRGAAAAARSVAERGIGDVRRVAFVLV